MFTANIMLPTKQKAPDSTGEYFTPARIKLGNTRQGRIAAGSSHNLFNIRKTPISYVKIDHNSVILRVTYDLLRYDPDFNTPDVLYDDRSEKCYF